ncbi:competence protein ComEA [Mangrovimonas yunxiaonensis]|uniref:Competence protein ComEA n=1 Tax=Mangrovimonas yunxiaonensis TaxID=1197477 RepID=A0A084TNS1_9FLAO|nr:helix-hairpin-helix domain-containing protein [Mangrovimonas yunxiaonensis]KFB02357.1 competence protein ComEA [Mangrovimonas yunxiaonensis]GGH39860.1 hypothetical protein GCM10011364_09540 [Mangrovimonas yunxiaonensis]
MKNIKPHFVFTKQQRTGVFLLLVLIVAAQGIYYFSDFSSPKPLAIDQEKLAAFEHELDSLKRVSEAKKKPKIYPFNPNYITDYKGYTLGMSTAEIDRLHNFRALNKWVNSASEFQQVTQVSDSLLKAISPYFKFPEWVTNPRPKSKFKDRATKPKTYAQKLDLNKASKAALQKVYGVGEKLSQRIIDYRTKHGGFAANAELGEIYGLSAEVIERLLEHFAVKTPRPIQRVNLNTATRDQLVNIPYIDYEIAYNIIEQRTLREGFNSFDELTKVKGFPLNKIEIIKLYLGLSNE